MSKKKYGLVISGNTGGIDNDTATKAFDSREFTFKYLDRKLYGDGVLNVGTLSYFMSYSLSQPARAYSIPHNLGYASSYRLYIHLPSSDGYRLVQSNGSGSGIDIKASMGKNNFTIYLISGFTTGPVYFVFLIGADNLEADADETRYIA